MSDTDYIRSAAKKYKWKKYYTLERPVSIGTVPKVRMMDFINYDKKMEVQTTHGVIRAWSEVYYDRELTEQEMQDYEMARE